MASTESTQSQPDASPALGKQGDTCTSCGKPLATDQRYCLNCGMRRAAPRVDFERHLFGADDASANGLARAPASGRAWSPLAAAALLGLLGIMLLVGVLIGKDENDEAQPTTAPPAQTTPAAGATGDITTPAPTATTPTPPPTGNVPAGPTPVSPQGATGEGAPANPGTTKGEK